MLPKPLYPPPKVPPIGRTPPPFVGGRRGRLDTTQRVSAAQSGRDCTEASCDSVYWDMVKESVKELYERETVESGTKLVQISNEFYSIVNL